MIIKREIYPKIEKFIKQPEAIVITGMRRVGKTTLLKQIMEDIESDNKIFFDLENPVNRKIFEEGDYEKIVDNLKALGLRGKERGYVFLDEIQFVKNLPSIVKYLYDYYKIKFILSGSSSFYIKNLFSESLSGRKYIFELHPFTFKEFLKLKEVDLMLPKTARGITVALFEKIDRFYDEYIRYGGFPGVVAKDSAEEKKMMLEDIFSAYFQLEITQLGDFKKTGAIRDLMLLLMERTGSKLDILKLSKEIGVARDTIHNYISFLEDTFFIKTIRPFSRNRDTEIRTAPKFYLCDTGLVNHFSSVSAGALFENAVFLSLRNRGEVNYYQRKSGVEIDFILDKKEAYEVKISGDKQDAKKLSALAAELSLNNYSVVSKKFTAVPHITFGFLL